MARPGQALPRGLPFDTRTLPPSEYRDHSVQQRLVRVRRSDIDHRAIFRAIANTEMGINPSLGEVVHLYGRSSGLCFYMYDDRGCILAGAPEKHEEWQEPFGDWIIQQR